MVLGKKEAANLIENIGGIMASVTKNFEISYGHRLPLHLGKCKRYHGHNGNIEVTITARVDKVTGMVIDFGDLSAIVKHYLELWDHRMILQTDDPLIGPLTHTDSVVIVPFPPTAENLAIELQHIIVPEIKEMCQLEATEITWWETEDSRATISAKY